MSIVHHSELSCFSSDEQSLAFSMDYHLSELAFGDLVVSGNLLGLKIKNSKIFILSDRVHHILIPVYVASYYCIFMHLVYLQLVIGHWVINRDFDWHYTSIFASNSQVVKNRAPAKVPSCTSETPSPNFLVVLLRPF